MVLVTFLTILQKRVNTELEFTSEINENKTDRQTRVSVPGDQ